MVESADDLQRIVMDHELEPEDDPSIIITLSLYADAPVMDTKITGEIGFAVYKSFSNLIIAETKQDCDEDGHVNYITTVYLDPDGIQDASLFELSQELQAIREKYKDQIHFLTDTVVNHSPCVEE